MQFHVIPATDLIQYTPKKQASMMDCKEHQYCVDWMKRWIRKHHPRLLRAIGIPSRLAPFTVDTGEQKPIRIPPRPCSPRDLALIKKFLKENQANGVLERAESPWSAPLVLAPKPDGKTCVCVDYRALNAITKKDAHPLPQIDESMARFADAKYFTTLEMKSGYWQIVLDPLTKQKLAFSTRYGQYQWNVLPFGPTNGPAAFQRRMMMVLEEYLDTFVIVYLDDILIYSNDEEDHEKQIKQVLRKLDEAGIILNVDKC
jgi:Reverse transcriptase (RNA-dependent DNA polymerase)